MSGPVPRHMIPKIKVECIYCYNMNVRTVMSNAYAEGYHRRHVCNDCDTAFYTLASYTERTYKVRSKPFKDRPLTPQERAQRLEWEAQASEAVVELGSPFATEFVETINLAFQREQEGKELTKDQKTIILVINELEKQVT